MRLLPVLILFLANISFAGIPVLALSDDGKEIVGEISETSYTGTLVALKDAVDLKLADDIAAVPAAEKGWVFSRFTVGLGLTGEIGIGPYMYSGVLKQRFVYSR